MEYPQLIRERYSVRKLSDKPVEPEKFAAILEAARVAPTAANKQPYRLLAIRDAKGMEKLATCTQYTFGAPAAVILCGCVDEAWVRPHDKQNAMFIDAGIVGAHIALAIHDLGLGSTWVGYFDPIETRKQFNIPAELEPLAIFPFGYPSAEAKPAHLHAKRRALEETVTYDSF